MKKNIAFLMMLSAVAFVACSDDSDKDKDKDEDEEQYTLTLSAGAHGTVVADPVGPKYDEDAVVTLTATPAGGYKVDAWTGADDDLSVLQVNHITMNHNKTVSVTFTEVSTEQYTLTLSPGANGTITAVPDTATYTDGTTVTLTAHPEGGYEVASWTGTNNNSLKTNTNTVTMTADKTVGATFSTVMYTLTLTSIPHRGAGTTWGSIHADLPTPQDYCDTQDTETIEFAPGTVVTLTAHEAVSTWAFTNWVVPGGANPTTCSIQVTMDADKTIEANFPLGSGTGCP